MHLSKRLCAVATAVVLTASLATLTNPASGVVRAGGHHPHGSDESAQVILTWERILLQTVYPAKPIPTGVPLLGFTSGAMYDAVVKSMSRKNSSEAAAAARAAHDVLVHYFPGSAATLGGHLATSLAAVPDVNERTRGSFLGAAAANEMLASRVGDHYDDATIHYTLPPAIGIWQPVPPVAQGGDMLGAWLGSLEPMVLERPIRVDGPDPLTSRAYARDYNEVKRLGGTDDADTNTDRTVDQTNTAVFFNSNPPVMYGDALIRYLESPGNGMSLEKTALLFAEMHVAMTDSIIQAWQLKRDVGFWRPNEAVAGAGLDGNPGTAAETGWTPLLTTPPYSEYVSGHASVTGPSMEVIRRTLGERTQLQLISANSPTPRTYPTLSALEHDAFYARIWGGLHFRDAMDDGYRIGHETARKVMAVMGRDRDDDDHDDDDNDNDNDDDDNDSNDSNDH